MTKTHLETLENFKLNSLPDLDVVTLGALELLAETPLPQVDFSRFKRPIVVGSGNAAVTGTLLFSEVDAVFADESSYEDTLDRVSAIDGAVLISASGSKHAVGIAEALQKRSLETILLTNNTNAPAKDVIGEVNTFVFPKNREPYTYNTSTYMGMLLSKTGEDPEAIYDFILNEVAPILPSNFKNYDAYYLMVPDRFTLVREMFATKFDELFGPRLMGRIFTEEQTKHAKTVIAMDSEVFVSFGEENKYFGTRANRIHIPLPEHADYVAMMAIGYFVIGQLQKNKPAYFKGRIAEYCREISDIFGQEINPIVE